ncbi:MAG: glycogen debranching protein GlgX [Burkholderiales bacterium]
MKLMTQPGSPYPLGASVRSQGVNFSVFSKSGARIELLFFDGADDARPSVVIPLDPRSNRTYHYWHVFVPDVQAGQLYGYRACGPFEPQRGLRFDPGKVLLDPYGKAVVVPDGYSRINASLPGDNCASAMKSVVADPSRYDWEGDVPLKRPFAQTVIYEMHVGGFTRHSSSGLPSETRGTYRGLIDKTPYLEELGVTAVELLPVFQFDAQDAVPGHVNYWGYSPVSFFAPHVAYSSNKDRLGAIDEFRDMVKALHRAGIEIILDVVFNHTAEANHEGPTLCYRGLENAAYYILQEDRSRYADYTGTGNTLNANQPIVRRLIVDSLRYWVEYMHVDGFRFDLASILSRDERGRPLENPPILWDIESDPVLAGTKLIAEAWDAAGLYQVGTFVGDSWKEWNGQFRDDVRSFMKADRGTVGRLAQRLLGSPDIYGGAEREPEKSINFVTCHDGFTLNDLVSYNGKHNEANGEDNRDGSDFNLSWNFGVEGPTDDQTIERLRNRQVKNFLALTLLSVGAPILLMGDEVRRTQRGNNNAYCQDNDISWFDWSGIEKHADIHRFTRLLLLLRSRGDLARGRLMLNLNEILRQARVEWHGVRLGCPDWSDESHSLAFTAGTLDGRLLVHGIVNAYWEPLTFELPPPVGVHQGWHRGIDTSLDPPEDICDGPDAAPFVDKTYRVEPRSIVLLFSVRANGTVQSRPLAASHTIQN